MEFTKMEKRILNDMHKKTYKIYLWIGAICLIVAIGSLFFTAEIAKRTRAPFIDSYVSIEKKASPKTPLEIKLKRSLLEAIKAAEEGWYVVVAEKGLNLFSIFLYLGIVSISLYFVHKSYMNLIKKLTDSTPK